MAKDKSSEDNVALAFLSGVFNRAFFVIGLTSVPTTLLYFLLRDSPFGVMAWPIQAVIAVLVLLRHYATSVKNAMPGVKAELKPRHLKAAIASIAAFITSAISTTIALANYRCVDCILSLSIAVGLYVMTLVLDLMLNPLRYRKPVLTLGVALITPVAFSFAFDEGVLCWPILYASSITSFTAYTLMFQNRARRVLYGRSTMK